jgi:flagellar biosynthetic protein FliQ
MQDTTVIHLALMAMMLGVKLSAPILLTALAIGFGISLFQSVTQIQEVTLSFVPKAIGVGVAILLTGNWMLHELVSFTVQLYSSMPQILQTG